MCSRSKPCPTCSNDWRNRSSRRIVRRALTSFTPGAAVPSIRTRCGAAIHLLVLGSALARGQTSMILPGPSGRSHVRFEIRVPSSTRSEPLTGRVYVIFGTDSAREPRTLVGRVGAPLFGRDVERLAAGAPATIDGTDLGTPVFDMADIPAGDYWVQPF